MNLPEMTLEQAYAYLLNVALLDLLPDARVVWSDKLDDYGAYYMLLPMNTKAYPLEIGRTYSDASSFVFGFRYLFGDREKASMIDFPSLQ